MIFEDVLNIRSKEEFSEKILIYIRLVEVLAEREKITIPQVKKPTPDIIAEITDMGIVNNEDDLKILKKLIPDLLLSTYPIKTYTAISLISLTTRKEGSCKRKKPKLISLKWLISLPEREVLVVVLLKQVLRCALPMILKMSA